MLHMLKNIQFHMRYGDGKSVIHTQNPEYPKNWLHAQPLCYFDAF